MKRTFCQFLFYISLSLHTMGCGSEEPTYKRDPAPNKESNEPIAQVSPAEEPDSSSSDNTTETANPQRDPRIDTDTPAFASLFVFAAGYSTCPTNSFTDPDELGIDLWRKRVLQNPDYQQAAWIMSCHGLNANALSWKTSWNNETGSGSRRLYKDMVITTLQKHPEAEFFLIGHSYGGWTVLDLAQALPDASQLQGIITLDPISVVDCIASQAISQFLINGTVPEGCQRQPKDLSGTDLPEQVLWHNYFQTTDFLLRSGAMSAADRNEKIDYEAGAPLDFQAHNAFPIDADLAQRALDALLLTD